MAWALMLAIALQASSAPSSAAGKSAVSDDQDTIVVVAPLPSLKRALDRCVEGGCTPREDIVASIRYAEAIFRAGRYVEARWVLQDAIGRDKGAAAREPVAVAALYEATVTVALHDGEQNVAKTASGARMGVLRRQFGTADRRFLQADLDDIDLRARLGDASEREADYRSLENSARRADQPMIAAAAAMRRAWLENGQRQYNVADGILNRLIADPAMDIETRRSAKAMLVSFARDRSSGKVAAHMAAGEVSAGPPRLLWEPALPSLTDLARSSSGIDHVAIDRVTAPSDVTTVHWVDLGFRIEPDGSVEKVEVLGGDGHSGWSAPIVSMIAQRRYSASTVPAEQRTRVERWSLTADYDTPKGSLIRRRITRPHYVRLDLTPAPPIGAP